MNFSHYQELMAPEVLRLHNNTEDYNIIQFRHILYVIYMYIMLMT